MVPKNFITPHSGISQKLPKSCGAAITVKGQAVL